MTTSARRFMKRRREPMTARERDRLGQRSTSGSHEIGRHPPRARARHAFTAILVVVAIAGVLADLPVLRPVLVVSLSVGVLVAGALILARRRARGAPPAARLNFPPDHR